MFNKITFILILLIPLHVFSGECLLTKATQNPLLKDNEQFWREYSELISKGHDSNKTLDSLIKKYDPKTIEVKSGPQVATTTFSPPRDLKIHKTALKEIDRLPSHLKVKVDGFISEVTSPQGIKAIFDNPGKYHFEKLVQFGKDAHSVRLSNGYRILFDIKDNEILIRQVNKGDIHRN